MALNDGKGCSDRIDAIGREVWSPPGVPHGFRARLLTRMAAESADPAALRAQVENEWRRGQERLRRELIALRWQTLVVLLGVAFAAGAVVMAGMPWVEARFGGSVAREVPVAVAGLGLVASWARAPLARWWGG